MRRENSGLFSPGDVGVLASGFTMGVSFVSSIELRKLFLKADFCINVPYLDKMA